VASQASVIPSITSAEIATGAGTLRGSQSTFAEKLVASQKYPKKGTVDLSENAAFLLRNMETLEKTESGYLDRVGRRL